MNIWERHGYLEAPFVVFVVALRRMLEAIRLVYWRTAFGWKIGRNVRVHLSVHIPRKLTVRLGDGAVIARGTQVSSDFCGGVLELGDNANIAQHCTLDVSGELRIGSNVTISEWVAIYTHSHGRNPRRKPTAHTVSIEDDAWICTRALVLSSAKSIGARSIVGPFEVVRSPLPPDTTFVQRHDLEPGLNERGPRQRSIPAAEMP